jgi:hypothetical protein
MTFQEFRTLGEASNGVVTGAMLSGSDYWSTINSVLSEYSEELSDVTSSTYSLLSMLSAGTDDFTTISAFIGIDEELFTPSEIINFINNFNLQFTPGSVAIFMGNWTAERRRSVKEFLFNRNFPNGKNLFSFITSEFNGQNPALLKENVSIPEAISDPRKLLVSPRIAYGRDGFYSGVMEAENDYWSIISAWKLANTQPTSANKELSSLISTLLTRNYSNSTYGVPLLMEKPIDKALYSSNLTIDSNVVTILKKGYASLSRDDVSRLLNGFIDEFSVQLEDFENFEYSDLVSYVNVKVNSLVSNGIADMRVSEAKEVKFYLAVMSKFVGSSSVTGYSSLLSISDSLESDLNSVRAALFSIKEELLSEGKFN